ncbi:heme oxygenase [Rickenella mellea]|uniref:Heme oxygenase n=1 Tax=Rickenella mellea TaxID=50990 RepID=A0A4Y7Q396_9AGAM|nr:heme oxygenase [Rickenella mellea]
MAVIDMDLSQPIATLLRTGTADIHKETENSKGAGWLARCELDREEYVRFIMMLWHVYDTLEQALERHSAHPVLSPTYSPALLNRAPALASDISHLLQTSEASWQSHPLHQSLTSSPPQGLTAYTSRISAISDSADPSPLLAHSYVRYLGDLSGGQIVRRQVVKAYGLQNDGGLGSSFYEFKQLGGEKSGNIGDLKKIKEWYRDGMNQGAGDNPDRKFAIVQEAVMAFELNGGLFDELRAPTSPHLDDPSSPPLGNPNISDPSLPQEPKVVFDSEVISSKESTFSVSAVLSFILALGLAHFALVVGGFTGAKGLAKWEIFQEWFEGLLAAN